jgi:sulfur-carrier protein adenylyltransferase/sulfurtransferase
MGTELSQAEMARYARHIIMPEIGEAGQRKLKEAAVLVVGAGGLGSAICLYLAAAGVGHIGVVDDDVVDTSNLQRQVIHDTPRLGQLKAESARERMLALNPHLQVEAYGERFTAENGASLLTGYEIVVDGTDNFASRYLINDLCVPTGKIYVYGSIYRFEGQVSVFDARQGPCYRCLFAEQPSPGATPIPPIGPFGVLPGTIGTIQATEVIKLILGVGTPLIGKLLLYDALDMSFQLVQFAKNPHCPACGRPN